jgi:hypothetical protein
MSAPGRGARGGSRGRGPRKVNGTEDEKSGRAGSRRGGASTDASNGSARGLHNTLLRGRGGTTSNSRQPPRGPKSSTSQPRVNGTSSTLSASSSNGGAAASATGPPRGPVTGDREGRYARLKKLREREREVAMKDGYIVDPEKPRALSEAVTPVGRCQDMCPEFERASRILMSEVSRPEMVAITTETGETKMVADESRMVKKFRRSAAGLDEQLPSDLRPPHVLLVNKSNSRTPICANPPESAQ